MNNISKNVIDNVKDLLRIYHRNQSDLATYLNLPRQTISRIFKYEREIGSDECVLIAKYFDIDIAALFKMKDEAHLKKIATLYHGSMAEKIKPSYLAGNSIHDYGNGFYLSFDKELAKEWAVCTSEEDGYLHKFELDTSNLKILYLNEKYGVLTWLSVLCMHRQADSTRKYRVNSQRLIEKFYDPEIESYDVIVGYRADDSYFSYAKHTIKNEIDISLLERIMKIGDLGYQVFIQSEKAFSQLKEVDNNSHGYNEVVDFDEYFMKYMERDQMARNKVAKLIDSEENTLLDTIEKYLD